MKKSGIAIPGYAVKAGKVVAKRVPRDASAAKRQRPGGSKRVRVKRRGAPTLEDVLVAEEREFARRKFPTCARCDAKLPRGHDAILCPGGSKKVRVARRGKR